MARGPACAWARRQQPGLHLRRRHHEGGFVLVQIVEKELAQSLAIDRGLRGAALVQLVHDAPARAVAVGEAEVRIVHAVFAQVLPRARQHDGLSAAGVERGGSVFGEQHRALDRGHVHRLGLATAAGVGG